MFVVIGKLLEGGKFAQSYASNYGLVVLPNKQ